MEMLRSSTSHFKWEQKLISQTIKTLAINEFIAWRIFQRRDLFEDRASFRSLDSYRIALNKVQAMAEFIHDVAIELLSYADKIQESRNKSEDQELGEVNSEDATQLRNLALNRRSNRLIFSMLLTVCVLGYQFKGMSQNSSPKLLYCALCGQNAGGWRGHRSSYKCNLCNVHLCMRVYRGLRKSFWSVWHSATELVTLATTAPSPSRNRANSTGSASQNVTPNR